MFPEIFLSSAGISLFFIAFSRCALACGSCFGNPIIMNAKKNITIAPSKDPIHQLPIHRESFGLKLKPSG